MSTQFKRNYGLLHHVFVSQKPNSNSVVIGANDPSGGLWTRVLSVRAAHILWYALGVDLFPEKFENISANLPTFMFRSVSAPSITMDLSIERLNAKGEDQGDVEISGRNAAIDWSIQLKNRDALHLWEALNALLGIKNDADSSLSAGISPNVVKSSK